MRRRRERCRRTRVSTNRELADWSAIFGGTVALDGLVEGSGKTAIGHRRISRCGSVFSSTMGRSELASSGGIGCGDLEVVVFAWPPVGPSLLNGLACAQTLLSGDVASARPWLLYCRLARWRAVNT